jgi:hypothetical protein
MSTINLTTLARVKRLINFEPDSDGVVTTKHDALLKDLIRATSKEIERSPLFNRFINIEARTEKFNVISGQKTFTLKAAPISATANIEIRNILARQGIDVELSELYYDINYERGIITFDYDLIPGNGALQIKYTGGLAISTDRLISTISGRQGLDIGDTVTGALSEAQGEIIGVSETEIVIAITYGEFQENELVVKDGDDASYCTLVLFTQIPLVMAYEDLAHACDLQVKFLFMRKDEIGLKSVSDQGGSITSYEKQDLLPEVKRILSAYKRF